MEGETGDDRPDDRRKKNTSRAALVALESPAFFPLISTYLLLLLFRCCGNEQVAGPVVSSEWKSADLNVEEYRRQAPGCVLRLARFRSPRGIR